MIGKWQVGCMKVLEWMVVMMLLVMMLGECGCSHLWMRWMEWRKMKLHGWMVFLMVHLVHLGMNFEVVVMEF